MCYLTRLHFRPISVSLEQLACDYDIESVERMRRLYYVYWFYKLLNSQITCLELLSQLPINVLIVNTRLSHTFYTSTYCLNYSLFGLINRNAHYR